MECLKSIISGREDVLPPAWLCIPGLWGLENSQLRGDVPWLGQISTSVQVGSPFQGCVLRVLQQWYYKEVNE